ncbi:MAG: hypothetical protein HZR80_07525 [Candidatus Heimdallarchaeota archaeon]
MGRIKGINGFIDDIDPVIPCDSITEITDDTIKINIQKDKLRHKLEEGTIPENAFTYSNLKRVKIFDSNDNKFGKIVNMVFLPSGEPVFVLGGIWLEEFAEKIKFKEDIDLLLPLNEISSIKDQMIKLRMPIDELELSMNNVPMDEETQRIYLSSLKAKGQVEMRLLERRKAEEFRDFARFH